MRVLMFQPQFHGHIQSGRKRSTIRRSARCKPGDELSLRGWQGRPYRSKQKLLMDDRQICTEVSAVRLYDRCTADLGIAIDGEMIIAAGVLHALALREGFANYSEMSQWFRANHDVRQGNPFDGELIEW